MLLVTDSGRCVREEVSDDTCSDASMFPLIGSAPRFCRHRQARRFVSLALMNPYNRVVLDRASGLDASQWWLSAGSLFQTVWNLLSGRSATSGILDYDLIYYDADLSWRAEDRVIAQAAELFCDLPMHVQVRNQARVHIWYDQKFGYRYPPLRAAHHALLRFPCRSAAVAITRVNGQMRFFALFRLTATLQMTVAPNRRLPIKEVYERKASRWLAEWPKLRVLPW